jgi:hypothetical protein
MSVLGNIKINEQVNKYYINDKYCCLEMNIETNVDPEECFDFCKVHTDNIHVIIPQKQYSTLNNVLDKRTNKNASIVSFYSYAGGKPITQLLNGHKSLSKIPYPINYGTTFSSIKFPKLKENEILYIIIDSYPEILSITDLTLKEKLIRSDVQQFISKLKAQYTNITLNLIINETTIEIINKVFPDFLTVIISGLNLDFDVHINRVPGEEINNYLCDVIFGKIIGGQQQQFNGTLIFKDHTIVNFYNIGNISCLLRGSGLSLSGNGTSNIFVLLEKESEDAVLNISEYSTETNLYTDDNTEIPTHPNYLTFLKFVDICNYYEQVKQISKDKNLEHIKEFMQDNTLMNNEIELSGFDNFIVPKVKWYDSTFNQVYKDMLSNICSLLSNIRFNFKKKTDLELYHEYNSQDVAETMRQPINTITRQLTGGY